MIEPDRYKAMSKQSQGHRKKRIEEYLHGFLEKSAEANQREPIRIPMFINGDYGVKDNFNYEEVFFCRETLRDWGWFLYDGHLRPDPTSEDKFLEAYFKEPPPKLIKRPIPWYRKMFR